MIPQKKIYAFTLIELLVVIAIIVLTVAFGVPAFNKYGNNSEVASTAEQIQASLEKAYANSTAPPTTSSSLPKKANEIHLWLMKDGSSGEVVFSRPYYQMQTSPGSISLAQVDDPGNSSSFTAEVLNIPNYLHLNYDLANGHSLFCNFVVSGKITCVDQNSYPANQALNNKFDLILSSEKTNLKYRIEVTQNPFRVRTYAE